MKKKLEDKTTLIACNQVFEEWNHKGMIQEVSILVVINIRVVTHQIDRFVRIIVQQDLTSFDGSAQEKGLSSLNHCVDKGLNI